MSFDKSDMIYSLEYMHNQAAKIQYSLSELYRALKRATPRGGDTAKFGHLSVTGASSIAKSESEAVQALCDSLRNLITMIDQSTEGE